MVSARGKHRAAVWLSWTMLLIGVVSWPLFAFWLAKDEPQAVLALSELALIFSGLSSIFVVDEDV